MMRAVVGIAVLMGLLSGGAAQACLMDTPPRLERLAAGAVVIRAQLVARRPRPALSGADGRGGKKSEILTLRVIRTYKGEARAQWEVIWRLGYGVRRAGAGTPADPHFDPRLGGDYIAGLLTRPVEYVSALSEEVDSDATDGARPFLLFDFCSAGAAYLFPFDAATESRVMAILGEPQ